MVRIQVSTVHVTPARVEECLDQVVSLGGGRFDTVRNILVRRGARRLDVVRDVDTNYVVATARTNFGGRLEQLGRDTFDALTRLGTTAGRD